MSWQIQVNQEIYTNDEGEVVSKGLISGSIRWIGHFFDMPPLYPGQRFGPIEATDKDKVKWFIPQAIVKVANGVIIQALTDGEFWRDGCHPNPRDESEKKDEQEVYPFRG